MINTEPSETACKGLRISGHATSNIDSLPSSSRAGSLSGIWVTGQRRELPHVVQGTLRSALVACSSSAPAMPAPVPAEMPGHQRRVVVAVVRRDPVDVGVLPGEPAS
jgi:hypothetical protein